MWSLRLNKIGVLIAVGVLQSACSTSQATRVADPAPVQVPAGAGASAPAAVPQASLAPPPARANADFAHAVELVRAGKDEEAELAFQQIATGYPVYAGGLVNLGILYRKHGELAKSDAALHSAVQRDPGNAEGFNELGVTLRLEGKFHEAADAYNQAIMAKPDFAPAYRNLAIDLDLYLGDTAAALTAMEHYKELAPDDKAVAGWIADLKQRAGKNAAPPAPDKAGG
jgi:tetratricopeptide (TPR) repeat protein